MSNAPESSDDDVKALFLEQVPVVAVGGPAEPLVRRLGLLQWIRRIAGSTAALALAYGLWVLIDQPSALEVELARLAGGPGMVLGLPLDAGALLILGLLVLVALAMADALLP